MKTFLKLMRAKREANMNWADIMRKKYEEGIQGEDNMEKLNKWMTKNKLTLKRAGEILGGYSESVVSRWRRGEVEVPKAVVLLLDYV
jgi:hypothetical protein